MGAAGALARADLAELLWEAPVAMDGAILGAAQVVQGLVHLQRVHIRKAGAIELEKDLSFKKLPLVHHQLLN